MKKFLYFLVIFLSIANFSYASANTYFDGLSKQLTGLDNFVSNLFNRSKAQLSLPAPTVTISSSALSMVLPGCNFNKNLDTGYRSYIVKWSSTNADSCTASGSWSDWSGSKPTEGSQTSNSFCSSPTAVRKVTLSCTGQGGTVTKTVTIPAEVPAVLAPDQNPAHVKVLSPNDGEQLKNLENLNIDWDASDNSKAVNLYLKNTKTGQKATIKSNFKVSANGTLDLGDFKMPVWKDYSSIVVGVCYSGTSICDESDAPFSIISTTAIKCAKEGEYANGSLPPPYGYGCCSGFVAFDEQEGVPDQYRAIGGGSLCINQKKGKPTCKNVGTKSEGWFYADGTLIKYGKCPKITSLNFPFYNFSFNKDKYTSKDLLTLKYTPMKPIASLVDVYVQFSPGGNLILPGEITYPAYLFKNDILFSSQASSVIFDLG